MDQPLCNLGLPGFLRVFQLLLGRNNMVRKQQDEITYIVIVTDPFLFISIHTVTFPVSVNQCVLSPAGLS